MFIVEANTNRIGTCKKVGFGGGTLWIHVKGRFWGGTIYIYMYKNTIIYDTECGQDPNYAPYHSDSPQRTPEHLSQPRTPPH